MISKAATVEEYLKSLPEERRVALEALRKVILANLDKGIEEGMTYGMIGYYVPHSIYPPGYHCDPKMPLGYAGLASQKQYISLYVCHMFWECEGSKPTAHATWLRKAWTAAGKKLDMGKCCIRFKRLEDAPLDVIGELIRRVPLKTYIRSYEESLAQNTKDAAKRSAARKAAKKVTRKVTSASARGKKSTTITSAKR
ncbi:MAG: hypothetical protein HBSAPP03_16840 [Phycisphaerae bacterium]|nr:MAG: hypothetical protein HBSAPP03_16840 [Phycisphaerae bacterium]